MDENKKVYRKKKAMRDGTVGVIYQLEGHL